MLKGVEAKTKELNESILPPDVKVRPFYDRSDLVRVTTDTVEHNLLRGMMLVLIVLMFFLVSVRAAVIVALTIPLALLFSFIFLHARGVAANLLSIGAIDFGIIIDGTLVMVENIFRELGLREGQEYNLHEVILAAAKDVDRPIFYSVAVIIAGYIPIYALSGPSGKLFHPMADTMSIALVGALILTLTFVPVMCAYWFRKGVHEAVNKPFEWIRERNTRRSSTGASIIRRPRFLWRSRFSARRCCWFHLSAASSCRTSMKARCGSARRCRTRFPSKKRRKFSPQVRNILMKYPMVTDVGSELGRPDDGTDPTGFFNDEFYVGLKPYGDSTWKKGPIHNKAELTADIQKQLDAFPGVIFNYTQPAEDAVDEALTGLKSALAVKIYGPDLNVLQDKALEIKRRLSQVPGFTELTVVRELGQPSLLIDIDRDKIARYGINVADVEAVVQAAVGGQAATQVIQGEKLFDLVVRMKPEFRENAQQIGNLLVGTPAGQQIPLSELADIHEASGASFIYRENNSRYIGVQYSVEGRDLQSAVTDGQRAIADIQKSLPAGYRLTWGGEYSEFLEAKHQIGNHRAAGAAADFHDSVRAVRQFQISGGDCARRGDHRTGRRADRAEADGHAVQRLVSARPAGADGSFG